MQRKVRCCNIVGRVGRVRHGEAFTKEARGAASAQKVGGREATGAEKVGGGGQRLQIHKDGMKGGSACI